MARGSRSRSVTIVPAMTAETEDGWGKRCKHPKGDGESAPLGGYSHGEDIRYGPNCPLRKVKE